MFIPPIHFSVFDSPGQRCGLFGMIRLANEIVKLGSTDLDWPVGQTILYRQGMCQTSMMNIATTEKGLYLTNVHTFLTPYISDSQRPSRFKSAHYICWSGTLLCQGCVSASKINFAQSQCCYKNAHSWAHVWPPGLTAWRCSIWRTYILHLVMDIDNIEDHHFSNLTPHLCVEWSMSINLCGHGTQNC